MRDTFIGYRNSQREDENARALAQRTLEVGIQKVLMDPNPTEEKVRNVFSAAGCSRIDSLAFSPTPGVNGEIRGGKSAEYRYQAVWHGYEIRGGNLRRSR